MLNIHTKATDRWRLKTIDINTLGASQKRPTTDNDDRRANQLWLFELSFGAAIRTPAPGSGESSVETLSRASLKRGKVLAV